MSREQIKNHILTGLKILFALGLLYFIFGTGKIDISKLNILFNPLLSIPLLVIITFNAFLASERWRYILSSQGLKANKRDAFKLTLIGNFFNFAIPGGVGGDLVKGFYFIKQNSQAKMKSAITILIDRLLGLFTMTLLAIAVIVLFPQSLVSNIKMQIIALGLTGIFICFCILWAFVFSKRLYNSKFNQYLLKLLSRVKPAHAAYEALGYYQNHKKVFIKATLVSILTQIIAVFVFIWIGIMMGYEFTPATYFFAVPVGFIITAIPISPAGIGVGQAAFYFLFKLAHQQETDFGPLAISIYQVITFIMSLAGAYFYVRFSQQNKIEETR